MVACFQIALLGDRLIQGGEQHIDMAQGLGNGRLFLAEGDIRLELRRTILFSWVGLFRCCIGRRSDSPENLYKR